jgi:hypothetical protein
MAAQLVRNQSTPSHRNQASCAGLELDVEYGMALLSFGIGHWSLGQQSDLALKSMIEAVSGVRRLFFYGPGTEVQADTGSLRL